MKIGPRRSLQIYWVMVVLVATLLGWWLTFFHRQGDYLVTSLAAAGTVTPEQEEALRAAAHHTFRMFLFEGGFLALLLLASMYLILRSLQQEVLLQRQRKNFLSAVTHELRSPIASARLCVESVLLGRAEGAKQERYLAHAQDDLDRLAARVDQLLESARMTDGVVELKRERIDLAGFCRDQLARMEAKGEYATATFELEANGPVLAVADPVALETILDNLVSNAVKYGGQPPRVGVRVAAVAGRAVLEVADNGPGLRGADGERIFEPFARGEAQVKSARPGVGLGLYLVAELTRALGGKVRVEDTARGSSAKGSGRGTRVSVSRPLVREKA
ncbi:MAG: HAMP domain-containing sensor histidine kinase [Planctomycetota bacterium]|nr:HAMP domain-containing sensor histidine kinase [Planctomycetota bacterium]